MIIEKPNDIRGYSDPKDSELSELESLSLTTKTMFCKREKVLVQSIKQQKDEHTQEY